MQAEDPEIDLLNYWRLLVKRRWIVYTSVLMLTAASVLVSVLTRPIYTATARLQIEPSAPNVLPFQEVLGSVPDQRNDFYQTQYGLIQSRQVAREVITSLDLDRHPEFRLQMQAPLRQGLTTENVLEGKRIDFLLRRLAVSPVRNSRLVDVSFSSHDRLLAFQVANRVAETYIAFNSRARYNTSERATMSLAHQIGSLQEEIDAREKELQAYAREHGIIPLSEKQNITVKKLNDLNDAYTRAQASRIEAEARYAALRDASADDLPEVRENKLIQELAARLAELERREAQFSAKYKPDWPEMMRLRREIDETRGRVAKEKEAVYAQVVGAAESVFRAARNEEQYLRVAFEEMKRQSQEFSLKEIRYNNLKAEIASRRETLEALAKRRSETASLIGVNDLVAGNIRIIDPAEVPVRPSIPKTKRNVAAGLIAGLALGVGLAFLFDYLDRSIKTPEEMEQTSGLPSIGLIPIMRSEGSQLWLVKSRGPRGVKLRVIRTQTKDTARGGSIDLISHEAPKSEVSDAFREMRTALLVSRAGGSPRSILVTSSQPGEGKTVVAANLAITLSQIGRRVLLVDADLRKPRLHRAFGVSNREGLSNCLSGECVHVNICKTGIDRLDLVPSGPIPPNPADLLDSECFDRLRREFESKGYDHVIYDSPPVLVVADPAIIAARLEAAILVVQAGMTARDVLGRAVTRLEQIKARIVVAVLNQADFRQLSYYGYRNRLYYREESEAAEPRVHALHSRETGQAGGT